MVTGAAGKMQDRRLCPICNHSNRADARFCGSCGHPLPGKLNRRWLWLVGLLFVPALAFFLWGQLRVNEAPNRQSSAATHLTIPVQSPTPTKTLVATPSSTVQLTSTPDPRPTNTQRPTGTPHPTITPRPPTATPGTSPQTITYGQSINGRALEAIRIGNGAKAVILIGGLHAGFAPGSVTVAQQAATYFSRNLSELPRSITLYIIPNANPDSPTDPGELRGRLNARSVDLNRNWDCRWTANPEWRNQTVNGAGGVAPFSEPETAALRDFILARDPVAVVFWEARATNGLVSPGSCGMRPRVSSSVAGIYGLAAGYNVANFEDLTSQELNGDSTNWLDEQGIPAISVLLPTYSDADWQSNLAGIRALLDALG